MNVLAATAKQLISAYRPNPGSQFEFHKSPAKFRWIYGGSGGGKSRTLGEEALIQALQYPRNLGVIARDVLADLKRTTKVTFLQEVMPPELLACRDVEWREADHKLVFKHNKSEIHFIGLDEPGRLGSFNLGFFGIDECHLLKNPQSIFLAFVRQMRRPGVRHCGMFAGHPQGRDWYWREFIDKAPRPGYAAFKVTTMDNAAHLPEGFADGLLAEMPPEYAQRYVFGDFNEFSGAVFTEFNPDIHVIDPFPIPPRWARYRGMDYGLARPTTCVWAAVDEQENIFFYDEYGASNTPIHYQVDAIGGKTGQDEISATWLDGRSAGLRQQTNSGLITVAEQYRACGLPVIPSATGKAADVEAGILRMKGLFAQNRIHIMRSGEREGRLVGCPNLIRQLLGLCYRVPTEGEPLQDKFHGEDDYLDAARYIIGQRFGAAAANPLKKRDFIAEDIERELARAQGPNQEEWDYYAA